MGRLILVRHGESEGNRARLFAEDQHALPLTPLGYEQAQAAARLIGLRFAAERVFCSPYVRAHETARVIASHLDLPLGIEPDLYERDVGEHRGKSYDSLYAAPGYSAAQRWTWRPAGGESYADVAARVGPALDRLARAYTERDIVVVSHGGVMLALWSHVSGAWDGAWSAPNCGVLLIEHDRDGYRAPQVIDGAAPARDAGG
jgi:broad specificity phosphatase PhoE